VIVTAEVAVLVAFGIRLVIDLQSKDLDSKISQEETVLAVLNQSENDARVVQSKTATYKMIWNNIPDYSVVMKSIDGLLPSNTPIKGLAISINGSSLTISGTANKSNEADIQALETNLKSNSIYLKDSVMNRLEDSSGQLRFTFNSTLVNVPNKDLASIQ